MTLCTFSRIFHLEVRIEYSPLGATRLACLICLHDGYEKSATEHEQNNFKTVHTHSDVGCSKKNPGNASHSSQLNAISEWYIRLGCLHICLSLTLVGVCHNITHTTRRTTFLDTSFPAAHHKMM
jgi:hypothetical protein